MNSVCVFCGSSSGSDPVWRDAAHRMGAAVAATGRTLVYGGGNIGLMGVLADAALAAGGRVVGVIPGHLANRELAHSGVTELRVVDSMHERKALMADLADGFVALPGGCGTMDEFFEIWTWRQLGLHGKPIGLLDVNGFFSPLLALLDSMVAGGFVRAADRAFLDVDVEPERLLARMAARAGPGAENDG